MTTAAARARIEAPEAPTVKKLKQLGAWWRASWFRFGRSRVMRRLVNGARWHEPFYQGTFMSSGQAAPLTPVVTATRQPKNGYPLGVDLLTGQAMFEDPFGLYAAGRVSSPNMAVIGAVGTAKSTLVKTSLLRELGVGGRAAVFDRKRQDSGDSLGGEYGKLSDVVGGTRIVINQDRSRGTRINILDPVITVMTREGGATLGQNTLLQMAAQAALERAMTTEERWALQQAHALALHNAKDQNRVPILEDVIIALQHPHGGLLNRVDEDRAGEWGLPVVLALLRYVGDGDLAGLIDGETSGPNGEPVSFDAPLLVFDTSALPHGSTALLVMMAITSAYLVNAWVNLEGVKILVIEEAYSAEGMGSVGDVLRDIAKRSRGVGVSIWAVFHHLSDIPAGSPLKALINEAEILRVFRQDKQTDAEEAVSLLGLSGGAVTEFITQMPRGVHLARRGTLGVTVASVTRTPLEALISFTDDAMLRKNPLSSAGE